MLFCACSTDNTSVYAALDITSLLSSLPLDRQFDNDESQVYCHLLIRQLVNDKFIVFLGQSKPRCGSMPRLLRFRQKILWMFNTQALRPERVGFLNIHCLRWPLCGPWNHPESGRHPLSPPLGLQLLPLARCDAKNSSLNIRPLSTLSSIEWDPTWIWAIISWMFDHSQTVTKH